MIGAMFSFVDQIVNSLKGVIVGALVILAGYREGYPTVNSTYSTELFWIAMICFCGLPVLGYIINIVCMRLYPLNKAKMIEIQQKIRDIKESANDGKKSNKNRENITRNRPICSQMTQKNKILCCFL